MSEESTKEVRRLDVSNPLHYRVLNMIQLGLVPDDIVSTINCSESTVRRIWNDPDTPKHIESVQRIARCMSEVNRAQFDQLQTLSLNAMFDVLTNEDTTADQKIRAALAIFDRHPDGEFVKTAKNINKDEVEVGLSNDTMKLLKKIADKTNQDFIDVTPSPQRLAPATRPPVQPGPDTPTQAPAVSREEVPADVL